MQLSPNDLVDFKSIWGSGLFTTPATTSRSIFEMSISGTARSTR